MNYWLVTTEFPPDSGGGISTYCWHTAKMFAEKTHDVTVFVPGSFNEKKNLSKSITTVIFKVPSYDHLGYEAGLSYYISHFLETYVKENEIPDIIEFQEYLGIGYYTLQKKWLNKGYFENTKFLVTAHAPSFLYLKYNQAPTHKFPAFWIGEMEKNVLNSADIVISPSDYLINQLKLNRDNLFSLFNPYKLESYPKNDFTFGDITFFGKLTPQKGAIEMLAYFEEAWLEGKKLKLNVIGGGDHFFYPKKQDLGEYVKSKYSNRIQEGLLNFEGHINPDELPNRLAKSHIILIPSIVDNLPYTVIEAMHMEKVVLISKDGGQRELIKDGKNGFVFDHSIESDMINQIENILSLSNKEYYEIGVNARNSIKEKCNYETIYSQKIQIINDCALQVGKFPFLRPQKDSITKPQKEIKGLLSVVIPYYNMGKYVNETIDSIQKNNYSDYEIVLIDDGSTDNESIEKLNEFENFNNVTVHRKPNTGLSNTRNYGAKKANGEFIAFLDPDDSIQPDYYTKAVYILNKYTNISFVGCWAQYFGTKNYIWPSFNPEPPYILTHNSINSSGIIIRKSDYLSYGQNDPQFIYGMEDYDSIINLVKNGKNGVVIPEPLWNYRIRKDSLAQSFNKLSKNYLYRLISEKHSDIMSKYTSGIVNLLNANGPGMDFDNPTKALGIFHRLNIPLIDSKLLNAIKSNKLIRKIAKFTFRKLTN